MRSQLRRYFMKTSINGRSCGQVGIGNHTGTDHFDFDWIYHVWDHQCSHGWQVYEDVVYGNRWEFAV